MKLHDLLLAAILGVLLVQLFAFASVARDFLPLAKQLSSFLASH